MSGNNGKGWDGIHLRGRLGALHYKNSFIRILADILPYFKNRSTNKEYHSTCPQALYQARHYHSGNQIGNRQTHNRQGSFTPAETTKHNEYNVKVSNRLTELGN